MNRSVMRTLLASGANIEARDSKHRTALAVALGNANTGLGDKKTAQLLISKGANIYVRNKNNESPDQLPKCKSLIEKFQLQSNYQAFAANGTPPDSASDVYKLLSATPLCDAYAPVDFVENLQRIFSHAKWESKEQAAGILAQIQNDGRITADTAESILAVTFPPIRVRGTLQQYVGRGR